MIIIGTLILSSFISGVWAGTTPMLSEFRVFITNFPNNQNVTVTNPTSIITFTTELTLNKTGQILYPVLGWKTISLYDVDRLQMSIGFMTKNQINYPCIAYQTNPIPPVICATGWGTSGVSPDVVITLQVQGEQLYLAGAYNGRVIVFLQR